MSRYLTHYTDFSFKKLFGEEANKDLLQDFLNQLLPPHHQIADLELRNTKQMPAILNEPVFQKAFRTAELANLGKEQYGIYEQNLLDYWGVKAAVKTAFPRRSVGTIMNHLSTKHPAVRH